MMVLIEKRAPTSMPSSLSSRNNSTSRCLLTSATFPAQAQAQTHTYAHVASSSTVSGPRSRKRKVIADEAADKRARRAWSEIEYEEMLQEATLLREELELLVMVAAELCSDLACDATSARGFARLLARHEALLADAQDVTERQVREMAQQMSAMMQYLCRAHYAHFALVDMQEPLKDCRNRFLRFACQYADMIGLQ